MKMISPKTPSGKRTTFVRVQTYFTGLLAVSLSAGLFLLPLVMFFFHRIPWYNIPANLASVPVLGLWVVPAGLLAAFSAPLFPDLAGVILHGGAWGMDAMMGIIRFWANLPGCASWTVTPNLLEIVLFYVLMGFVFFFKQGNWAKVGTLIVLLMIAADVGYWIREVKYNQDLRVSFLDVGQANAALVEFPGGKKMMIDGGGFPRGNFDVGRMVVAPYLWHNKILKIDYLVLSHPQSDHMNGLRFIARAFDPEEFWYNGDKATTQSFQELMSIIEARKIQKRLPGDLETPIEINGATIRVLYPSARNQTHFQLSEKHLNNNSLVVKISYREKGFLFPGDLEQAGETALVSTAGDNLKSHVLLASHHGSKSSSTLEFLKRVRPDICVISAGAGNFFGFPHPQTLQRLQDINCPVVRIDRTGAVRFVVDGSGCWVIPHLGEPFHLLDSNPVFRGRQGHLQPNF